MMKNKPEPPPYTSRAGAFETSRFLVFKLIPLSLENYTLSRLPYRPSEKYPVPSGVTQTLWWCQGRYTETLHVLLTELWHRLWRHFFPNGNPGETEM